jgi:tetratricopeptide (TPR) repeat protein
LIVGRPPFEAPDIKAVSELVLYKEPRPPSEVVEGIPDDVDGVLARALTKARDDRYPSGRALAEDMAAVRENRRPTLAIAPAERTEAGGDATSISISPSAATAARVDKTTCPAMKPPAVLETLAKPPRPRRLFRRLVPILVLFGIVGYVVAVGPDRAKEQVRTWWTRLSDSMGRQVESVQTAVEETRAEQKRVSAARARAESLLQRGRAMEARGQWDRARREYESSLGIFREIEDGGGEASALLARGRLESAAGNWSGARADLDSAVSVYRIYDLQAGQARALVLLGNLERDLGNRDRADAHYGRASALAQELPDRRPWLEARFNVALLDLLQGKWAEARMQLDAVRGDSRAPAHRDLAARAALYLGVCSFADGDFEMAATWWEEARHTFQAGGEVSGLAEIELVEGRADFDQGHLESSRKHIDDAERAFRKAKNLPGLASVLENRLELALTEDDKEQQRVLWEELTSVRARLALPELDMPSRGGDDVTVRLDDEARFSRLESLLKALPRTASAEERLATFRASGSEPGRES